MDFLTAPLVDFLNFNSLVQCNTIYNKNNRLLDLVLCNDKQNICIDKSIAPLVTEDSHHPALDITLTSHSFPASNLPLSNNYMKFDFKGANLTNLYQEIGRICWQDLYN